MTDNAEASRHDDFRDRPVLVMITSHWLSMLGLFLLGTALITWIFVLPLHVRGRVSNPYIGIVVFIVVPLIFLAGLAFVPLGIYLARRRVRAHLAVAIVDRKLALRRLGMFLGVTALINVLVGTQVTYQAVERMESVQFCGQGCHVMAPEWKSHMVSPHARVACVDCHVGEGQRGWIESKMAGTRQLFEVAFNTYPRPVPPALESGRLVPSRETCERCHWPEKFAAARLRVISKFAEDESNTQTQTVLMMMVGGEPYGRHPREAFQAGGRDPLRRRRRAAPEDPLGRVQGYEERRDAGFPGAGRKRGLDVVTAQSRHAVRRLPQSAHAHVWAARTRDGHRLRRRLAAHGAAFSEKEGPGSPEGNVHDKRGSRAEDPGCDRGLLQTDVPRGLRGANGGRATRESVHRRNLWTQRLPGLERPLGHVSEQHRARYLSGCFRCHDDEHKSAEGKAITQDCSACHEAVAIEDAAPEVLKTLGLADRLAAIRKK